MGKGCIGTHIRYPLDNRSTFSEKRCFEDNYFQPILFPFLTSVIGKTYGSFTTPFVVKGPF